MAHMTLTTPLLGMVRHPELRLSTVHLCNKVQFSNATGYDDMKGDAKCRNLGGLEYLGVSQGH